MKIKAPYLETTINEGIETLENATIYASIAKFKDFELYTPYDGYYIIARKKYDNNNKIRDILVSFRQTITSTPVKITIYPNGNPIEKDEVSVIDAYYESTKIPTTAHLYSIQVGITQTHTHAFTVLCIYTDTSNYKVYVKRIGISYNRSIEKLECTETTTLTLNSHPSCIYNIFNYNVYMDQMYGSYSLFLYYNENSQWKLGFLEHTSPPSFTEITTLSINTERICRGYFNTSTNKYRFLKITNGTTHTIYEWNHQSGLSTIGTLPPISISITASTPSYGGEYFYPNPEIYLFITNKTYFYTNSEWITLANMRGNFSYKTSYHLNYPYFYYHKSPLLFNIGNKIYAFNKNNKHYLQYSFSNEVYPISEEYFFIIPSGFIYEIYKVGKENYTPCKCIIQKRIFESDKCYIEDEKEPSYAIEIYDDNDTLIFWGMSKEGYQYTPPKYSIEYISYWDIDLQQKLNTSFTNKKISEMITTILSSCGFLYQGTIDDTTNTYTITEQRTIKEFLQWAAYAEQKIITIEPDGKLHFTSGIYNNGNPYEITINDPQKSYKFTNYYPTKFHIIGGISNGTRLYATQIYDPNGDIFVMYVTNITSQTELNNLLAKIITMKSQQRFRMDFINYSETTLYKIGTIMLFTDEYDQFVDQKQCIVTAIDHEPLYPDKTSYLVYNTINYPQQQNQQEERITIIEQNQAQIDDRVNTLETGYRFVPIHSTTDIWQQAYIGQGNTVTDEYNCFSVDGNNRWTRISGSASQSSSGTMPTIPTSTKGLKLLIETYATGASNNNWTSIVGKNNANLRTFNYAPPTANYSHCIQADVFWTSGNEGRILVKINAVAGSVYCQWRCLGYWV